MFLFLFFFLFPTVSSSCSTPYYVRSGHSSDFYRSSFPIVCIFASKINKENNRLDSGSFPSLNQRSQYAPRFMLIFAPKVQVPHLVAFGSMVKITVRVSTFGYGADRISTRTNTIPVLCVMYSVVLRCLLRDYLINTQDFTRNTTLAQQNKTLLRIRRTRATRNQNK